jgi:hypothetical protein
LFDNLRVREISGGIGSCTNDRRRCAKPCIFAPTARAANIGNRYSAIENPYRAAFRLGASAADRCATVEESSDKHCAIQDQLESNARTARLRHTLHRHDRRSKRSDALAA